MTAKQWRERLALVGLGPFEFAALLRVDEKTVRRWISGQHQTPRAVEILLDLLCRGKITLEDLR